MWNMLAIITLWIQIPLLIYHRIQCLVNILFIPYQWDVFWWILCRWTVSDMETVDTLLPRWSHANVNLKHLDQLFMVAIDFPTNGTYVFYQGKKTVNLIHNHINIFAKSSRKFGINSHQCHCILFIFSWSITAQNYELWIVSYVYDIRMGTSSSESWPAHDFLLYSMSHTNEMDSCYHFSILFVFGTWDIFAFIYCFRIGIFTIHAFQKKIHQATNEILS